MPLRVKTGKVDRKARTLLEGRLDTRWSDYIKDRDAKCRKCDKRTQTLEAHHIAKRGLMPTRWEPLNGVTVCIPCHSWVSWRTDEARIWACELIGEDTYNAIVTYARGIARYTMDDLEDMLEAFKTGDPISRVAEMLEGVTA